MLKEYREKKLVFFTVDIKQKLNKDGKWKKDIRFPPEWQNFTLNNTFNKKNANGYALLTGKINNIIVIDVDNITHWKNLLKENNQEEPHTVKAISGSGGYHFYFLYDNELENIKSKTQCFGKKYDIDIRTNGGCIICPPSKYYDKNTNKEVGYIWEKSIIDTNLESMPNWMKDLLLEKKNNKKINKEETKKETKKENKEINKEITDDYEIIDLDNKDDIDMTNINFTEEELEYLIDLLSLERCDNYNDWVTLGMILYNIDKDYRYIWKKWSKKSDKYESGCCDEKWKGFRIEKNGVSIGTLLLWCKEDNKDKYLEFMKRKKMGNLILQKYPNDKLILGETIMVNNINSITKLKNKDCLIKGSTHQDMPNSMYVEILDKFMAIKCGHPECLGKIYPCHHILMNKNDMNVVYYNVTINNNNNNTDNELLEFQKIDIYDDQKLNELIYNGLNGEAYPLAKIVFYFYPDKFNYGEDENWYMFENSKWINIGKKNLTLRDCGQEKLKQIYNELLDYYKHNGYEQNKIKELKRIKKSIDNTNMKNNIMCELIEVYSLNNNLKRNFVKNLDNNNNLIGFDNGVYDLDKMEFREGLPEDNITLSVGYDYKELHSDKYEDLLKFLEDIQPNKNERDYMLTYLSIALVGNLLELFTILTGCGRNGKSKLIELLELTFGDYYSSVQSQLFTRPRPDANSPDPGLLSLSKKRLVIASEPEKNSKLNSGFIKFITGRDSTTLRNCHSNDMVQFRPRFMTLFTCNDIPECDDMDNAFSKRLRCINFPTEFVDEPKKENQKKIDTNINLKFNDWKLDFMLLLLDYYKKYKETRELKPTENILKWTSQYKEDTDMYLQYLNENTEENPEGHIHCTTLYENFKFWFKQNNPNTKIPSNKEFINNLKKYKETIKVKVEGETRLGIKHLKIMGQ
jgi:P4 family phage/plasmid primase-like protien